MVLIRDGVIETDGWVAVADGDPLPGDGPVLVSLERWRAQRAELLKRGTLLGVRLESGEAAADIAGDISHLGLIALEFPAFTDGRAYSTARLLRERYGYMGELRAVGHVLRDQFLFMRRCGFDSFEVRDNDAGVWQEAVTEINIFYQPAGDRRITALQLRHRRSAAE